MIKYAIILFALMKTLNIDSHTITLPKVLIITTGGTIASQSGIPMMDGQQLIQAVPGLADIADVTVEELVRVGSSKMSPKIWLQLVQRINEVLNENPNLKCVIVTHGTDTMEETAFFLNLTHKRNTPVILVGSMRSANEISADGPVNLLNAVRVGIADESIGKGVLVVMNDNISAARDLLKMNNNRVDAFQSADMGYLGAVDSDGVYFYRSPIKVHTTNSEFDIYNLESLPEVDIVQDFAGFDPEILSYYLGRESKGLVISSFAGGRLSNGFGQLSNLPEGFKPVVIASSIREGRISGSNKEGSPIIISNELPANKARIMLMLALTKTNNALEIQSFFDKY